MKHLIEIEDSSETGKSMIHILQNLAIQDHSISFLSNEPEEVEDDELLKLMLVAENSGEINEGDVLKTLAKTLK